MSGEQQLINRIRRAIPSGGRRARSAGVVLGIGDDAALLRPPRLTDWVLTCDWFIENVHFIAGIHPPNAVGYKSLARATSDVAAMGAFPRFFLLSLMLPAKRTGQWLDSFLGGMRRAATKFGLTLIGGDVAQHAVIAISITVVGEVPRGRAIRRDGARAGDQIFVSGTLGAAQLGLELVLRGLTKKTAFQPLLRAHLYPELRLALGQWLARSGLASAMIDTSDGFSTDLGHIAQASGAGARIWLNQIPVVRMPEKLLAHGINATTLALHGGEDYELLFTVPRRFAAKIPPTYQNVPLTRIGEITREKRLELIDAEGRAHPLTAQGWDHFRKASQQSKVRS